MLNQRLNLRSLSLSKDFSDDIYIAFKKSWGMLSHTPLIFIYPRRVIPGCPYGCCEDGQSVDGCRLDGCHSGGLSLDGFLTDGLRLDEDALQAQHSPLA